MSLVLCEFHSAITLQLKFSANAAAQRNGLSHLFEERESSYQESYRLELIFATLAAFETLKAMEYISLAISGRVSWMYRTVGNFKRSREISSSVIHGSVWILFHKYVVVDHPSTFRPSREIRCVWRVTPTMVNASGESGKVEEGIFCEF